MALSGMTGFGRTEGALGPWTWAVEARSVNGRNLDVKFRGPPGFETLDRAVREGAQSRFLRGQVSVGVQAKRSEAEGSVRINQAVLERYLAMGVPLLESGRAAAPSLDGLLALRGVIEAGDTDDDPQIKAAVEAAMARSVAEALDGLKASRLGEGEALTPVLADMVDAIEGFVRAADAEAATQPVVLKERFARRLAELVGEAASEERIIQEAAVQAVKADVREELDRLRSHIDAARALIATEGGAGRKLDFLMQEFMREANTLCSKSATSVLTALGLDLKATIEQLREQVQNVE
jgi:uncharacterized protein (TIGR00255 family)